MMTRGHFFVRVAPFLISVSIGFAGTARAAGERARVRELQFEPAKLILEDGRDARRVLVWGVTEAGGRIDLTGEAAWEAAGDVVGMAGPYIEPKQAGEAIVRVQARGLKGELPVEVKSAAVPPVQFTRDVAPVLSKAGCNAGTCHGAAKGKNGFKLSLRGYDPAHDYEALVTDLSGRRFNRVEVEQSLLLLKPTGEVPHEGLQVIRPKSREYELLRQWIAEGTRFDDPAAARAQGLEILPAEIEFALPGETQQLIVLAKYPSGAVRDVTRDAIITSNNEELAQVAENKVTGVRRGEAALMIRYEGNYATREVRVMGDRSGFEWAAMPEHNFIDQHVNAKLAKMKILPSDLCTDAEFARRVSLDLTGQPPAPERVRSFLGESGPSKEKRERLIEELLNSREGVDSWANKWADLLQCNSESLGEKGVWLYREWIRQGVAKNTRYDQLVRDLLLASGSSYANPAVNYYRAVREPGKITEDVSQTFLGTRFNCNKCHDHPFEKWTQDQYYQFGAYFAQVAIKRGTLNGEEIVYHNYNGGEVLHPKTGMAVAPKVPYGEAQVEKGGADRREAFIRWMTSLENPLFAKSMANRMWSYFFARGIIDPVDDIRGSNPPSNGPLLDALTQDFERSGFDLKHLMRVICQSRTYQLSFRANRWNEDDTVNFSHALPRRLSAEQLLDAVSLATGHRPRFDGLPAGLRSVELPDGMVRGNEFLALFGRPKRQSACECERTSNLTLSHAMNLINGKMIGEAVSAADNRIKQIVESAAEDRKAVEEIYLACLSRPPTEQEAMAVKLGEGGARLEAAQDLAWALLNSPAFLFNR